MLPDVHMYETQTHLIGDNLPPTAENTSPSYWRLPWLATGWTDHDRLVVGGASQSGAAGPTTAALPRAYVSPPSQSRSPNALICSVMPPPALTEGATIHCGRTPRHPRFSIHAPSHMHTRASLHCTVCPDASANMRHQPRVETISLAAMNNNNKKKLLFFLKQAILFILLDLPVWPGDCIASHQPSSSPHPWQSVWEGGAIHHVAFRVPASGAACRACASQLSIAFHLQPAFIRVCIAGQSFLICIAKPNAISLSGPCIADRGNGGGDSQLKGARSRP